MKPNKFDTRKEAMDYIDSLQLNDLLKEVISLNYGGVPFGFGEGKKENYNNLVMDPKPVKAEIKAHFDSLIDKYKAKTNRFFKNKNLKNQAKKLDHYKAAASIVLNEPNFNKALEMLEDDDVMARIIEENDKIAKLVKKDKKEKDLFKELTKDSSMEDIVKAIKLLAGV